MDELEFCNRAYANPRDLDDEILEAAQTNPDLQKIADETLAFEDSIVPLIKSIEAPEGLLAQLLSIPQKDEVESETAASVSSNVSPMDVEFSIRDDRFNGIVAPMEQSNMILVGDKDEDLN